MNKRLVALALVLGVAVSGIALLEMGQQPIPQDEFSTVEDQLDELESFLDFLTSWENIDLSSIEEL